MSYAAVSAIGDAIDATREFLTPVDRGRWLRLAVVVLFLSGGSSLGSIPNFATQGFTGGVEFEAGAGELSDLSGETLALIAAVVAIVMLIGLVYVLISSIMEFVLVDSLRREEVTVRASFSRYTRAGLSLFAFRVLLGVITLLPLAVLGWVLFEPLLTGDPSASHVLGALALFVPAFFVLVVLAAIVHGLTVEFVVQVMIAEEEGVVAGWRDFWPTLWGNLGEFVVYVLVRFGLLIAVGIVGATVAGIAAVVIGIPFAIIGFGLLFGVGWALTPLTAIVLAILVIVFVLLIIAVSLVVQVPLKTFTRYFELLVLGDIEPEFDLIPERRAALRGGDGPGDDSPGDDSPGDEFDDTFDDEFDDEANDEADDERTR